MRCLLSAASKFANHIAYQLVQLKLAWWDTKYTIHIYNAIECVVDAFKVIRGR